MIKVDLITGFLGSGKTTFIKKYAAHLVEQGKRICILENDFGAVNVDMLLLQDIMSENCELEMVAGGCDADCHKRRFKTKLISMGMRGFDRVLIEPSGIFDVDEFYDSLREEPLDRWYEIGSVITIVDAALQENLTQEAEYLLASQLAGAGIVLLSKGEQVEAARKEKTCEDINRVMEKFGCPRRFTYGKDILDKPWDKLGQEDYERVMESGYHAENMQKLWFDQRDSFQSLYYMHVRMSGEKLQELAKGLLSDPACGHIIRIKGFLADGKGGWLELNATREQFEMKPVEKGQEVLIVIGENLEEQVIGERFAPYIVQEQ